MLFSTFSAQKAAHKASRDIALNEQASAPFRGVPKAVQGDHGGQRLGFVDCNVVVTHCQIVLGQLQIAQKLQSSQAR